MASAKAQAVIAAALRERQLLAFVYKGHPRAVEPHILGVLQTGEYALSSYQVAGTSRSGGHLGWKTFHVAGMAQVSPMPRGFDAPRPDYNPGDPAFRRITERL